MSNPTIADKSIQASMDLFQLQKTLINGNTADVLINESVSDLVQKRIQERPNDIAINGWDGDLTYAQLAIATNNIATRLGQVGNGDFIALCVPRSKWTPVTMLAALQTGAAFVHLDPAYPTSRITAICAACSITTAICLEETADILAAHVERIVTVTDDDLTSTHPTLPTLGGKNAPSDTCYVVFTSGSSGTPKGVVVPHSAICTSILAQGYEFRLSPSTRVLQFAPATFDASMFELITTLCFGSCVCIPSKFERENDPIAVLNKYRTDIVFLTPSMARSVEPENVPFLKTLIVGGEAPDENLIDRWLSAGRHISNVYGPSECAVSAAVLHYDADMRVPAATIGGPFGGGLWVVDPDDYNILMEPGKIGELIISGRIVTDGYLGDSVKTNAVFVPSPQWWGDSSSGRSYKTGDLVKYGLDGLVLYVGRADSQVKVRGQRLELGEVEHHLRRSPLVDEATACVPRKGLYNGHLTGILTLRALSPFTDAVPNAIEPVALLAGSLAAQQALHVQQALKNSLPPYMVPTQWLVVRSMPRSASDKLDVRRIQSWMEEADPNELDPSRKEIQLPTTPAEEILLAAWKRVLNETTLGITDQFIRRGGDSILAMQVVSECRKQNLNVSVRSLLGAQSLADIAQEASMAEINSIEREEDRIGEPFELSPVQKLYFESDPEGTNMCNQSVSLSLEGDVALEDLQQALTVVVSHHSMLRARFDQIEAQHWIQYITMDVLGSFQLREHQLQSDAQKSPLIDESERSIDIRLGPVLTADIFDIQGKRTMHLAAHHLLVDFVSWRVILDDLDAVLNGDLVSLEQHTPMTFSQWTKLQASYAQSISVTSSNVEPAPYTFWEISEKENTVSHSTETTFELDAFASEALLGPSNIALASEPVDLLMAALLYSFRETFPAEREIPQMYAEGHGREPWDASIDISGTVGWFTTMYPIAVEQSLLGADITDIIRAVSIARRSLSRNGLDYFTSRYLTAVGQETCANHSSMEILFNFGGTFSTTSQHESKSHFSFATGSNGLPFDEKRTGKRLALFEITSIVKDGRFVFNFQHPRELRRGKQVLQWFQTCQETLVRIAQELPSMPRQLHIAEFPLVDIAHSDSDSYITALSNQLGLQNLSAIEDVYPCSPIQRGILVSQSQHPQLYQLVVTWEITDTGVGRLATVDKFCNAWQQVVDQNAILRTVFIDDTVGSDAFHQVTLRAGFASACMETLEEEVDMEALSRPTYSRGQPHHRMVVQQESTGTLNCRLDISHALADGASLAIVVDQIRKAYAGTAKSKQLAYREYIGSYLAGKSQQVAHLGYWKSYLADATPCLFPTFSASLTTTTGSRRFEGLKTIHFQTMDRDLIQSFCQEHGVTISSVFQLAWTLCLQTYTNQSSISFGYLVSQRNLPLHGIESAVGPYINTVVRHIYLDGESKTLDVLHRLQDDLTEGLEHASSSLSDVLRASNADRGGLYNTSMSYQRYSPETSISHELQLSRKTLLDPSEDMVALDIDDFGTHVDPFLTYWQSFLSDDQAQDLAKTVESAIAGLIRGYNNQLNQLSIIPQQHIAAIHEWNESTMSSELCLHDLVSQQAHLTPNAIAVEGRDGRFTYAEIEDLSTRLAHYLIQNYQLERESKVLFCSEKTALAVIIMLGILKAGGACVAIDPAQPMIRLQHIAKETDAKLAFASTATSYKLADLDLSTLTFTSAFLLNLPAAVSSPVLVQDLQPKNLAVIVYTSGSTGLPKGIMLEHGSLCASILAHANALKISSTTRALQFASWSFDVSLEETFTTLSQGGCVCVPTEWDRKNDLGAFIRDFDVNWVDLVPGMARQLSPESIPSVKTMILGGERLPVDVARKWAEKVHLINVYGPAECSINATYDDTLTSASDGSSIGRVLSATRAWVVSPTNHNVLMPIGGIGELILSGPTVMRGYINDETRTAAALFSKPAWAAPQSAGETFYKTGDLVRLGADGKIFLLGRKDAQRKLRGHRIDLEEIQQVILDSPKIGSCTVALPRTGFFKETIVAVVAFKGAEDDPSSDSSSLSLLPPGRVESIRTQLKDVHAWVAARLPALMVPTAWAIVSSIPELASGKLNISLVNRWLTEMDDATKRQIQDTLQESAIQAPSNEIETSLLSIWAEVLHRPGDSIGVNRPFLSMGGDSLAAMQIRSRARNLGLAVSVENLLSGLTIADIAKNAGILATAAATVSINDDGVPVPLTAIQKTYLSSATPATMKRFNLGTMLKILLPISLENLRAALLGVVTRHGALRTRFMHIDGAWSQQASASSEEAFHLDFRKATNRQEIEAAIEDAQDKVDVLVGRVLAGALLEKPSGEQLLFLTAHHLVVDIVSWQIITDELQEALQTGKAISDQPLSFTSWSKHMIDKNLIDGADLSKWSTDSPNKGSQNKNVYGDAVDASFTLDLETTSSLLALSETTDRVELVDLLLTAVIKGYQLTFESRPLPRVLIEDHGRHSSDPHVDPYGTIGWFTSMAPIFADKKTIESIFQQVKTVRREYAGKHWMASYMHAAKDESAAVAALEDADILFNYVGQQHSETESVGALFSRLEDKFVQASSAAADLVRPARFELLAMVQGSQLQMEISFNGLLDNKQEIANWGSYVQQTLVDLTNLPKTTLERLTASDCKLIAVNEHSFEQILALATEREGILVSDIEDIYPCHPVQEGMLVSQARDPDQYMTSSTWELCTKDGSIVDVDQLNHAWGAVVQNHTILRTIFVEGAVRPGSLFAQVVVKSMAPHVTVLPVEASYDAAFKSLEKMSSLQATTGSLLHRLTICQGGTQTVCRLDISHTIIDGASMYLLIEQLAAAYQNTMSNPLTKSSYKHLVEYWLNTMPDAAATESLDFWKSHLAGIEPSHFPKLSKATADQRVDLVPIKLASTERLRDLSKTYGITPFNIVQVAWSMVLRAFTGNDSVAFGYLTSGRHRPIAAIEQAIGPYFTMLVCKTDFTSSTVLLDSLRSAQTDFLESFTHQEVPLSSIHHALGLRDGTTLFNTLLTYQASADRETNEPSLTFNEVASYDPTEYDITLGVVDTPSGIKVGMEYTHSCLAKDQALLVAEAVSQAIENILRDPMQTVGGVTLVGPTQSHFVLDTNATLPVIVDELLHDEISKLAAILPNAVAVESWDGSLTRVELDQLSSNLAAHLSITGFVGKPGQIIPLCFNKSKWAIVAVIAVLKAGAAVTFMPQDGSPDQLRQMAEIADATMVLGDATVVPVIEAAGLQCLEVTATLLAGHVPTPPRTPTERMKSTDMSFVVFTSGSTGTPKAVVHTHGSVAATSYSERMLGINTAATRRLQFAGYSFDVAVTDIISTLRAGGCVCIPSEHQRIHELAATIEKLGANAANLTPTVVRTLQPAEIPCMKHFLVGGEALSRDIIQTWSPKLTLVNSYGPAESGINGVCNFDVHPDTAANIGKPFPTMRVWLVDPFNLNVLASVGAIGEIILEGSGVAREYLKNDEKTTAAFPSPPMWYEALPSSMQGQGRLYATGDLARYAADGTVEFLGRKSQETKLHGHRIDLQAVEDSVAAVLKDNNLFVAAEVINVQGLGKRLLTFVSSHNHVHNANVVVTIDNDTEGRFTGQQWMNLRQHLKSSLSKHSIPTALVPVFSMPLTQSRKIHRRALRELDLEAFMQTARVGAISHMNKRKPLSEYECLLQQLWAKAIGIDHELIGLDDQFFDMGGDSVAAMALAGFARDAGLSLKTSLVFQQVTLEKMAQTLNDLSEEEIVMPFSLLGSGEEEIQSVITVAASICKVSEDAIEDVYPCTPLQEGLLALSGSQQNAYLSSETIRLMPNLDIDRLERAFDSVAQAEPILRTRLAFIKGYGTLQVVVKEQIAFARTNNASPPAMSSGQPLVWFSLSKHQLELTWVMHHAVYDGFSRKLLLEKIGMCYENEQLSLGPSAPYSSYVAYTSKPGVQEAAKAYWTDRLTDATPPTFPRVVSTKQNASSWTNAVVQRKVDLPTLSHGITAATVVQTAWALTVSRHSDHGTDDVVFGMTVAGRDAPVSNLDRVTGPCIATVPARVRLPKEAPAMEILRTVQEDNVLMRPYVHVGLQEISKSLPKEAAHVCSFKSSLVIQPTALKELGAEGLPFGSLVEGEGLEAHPFALVAECGIAADGIELYIMYDDRALDTKQLDWILTHFEDAIQGLGRILGSNDTISTLSSLKSNLAAELMTMQSWNGSHPEIDDICLHDLFAQTVARQPEAIAVDSHEGKWTYKQLDELSNTLAHDLQSRGIRRESMVAVCFGKTVWAIVSILAIWKAGGAYVPLDPLQPVERLHGLINQAKSKLVLAGTSDLAEKLASALMQPSAAVIDAAYLNGLEALDIANGLILANALPTSTCFVLFTSGSTGQPKGVVMTHRTIATSIRVQTASTHMLPESRVLHYSSLTFDMSVLELYGTLSLGGCICVPSDDDRMSNIGGFMARKDVTWAFMTPTTANAIPNPPASLSTLVLGGEPVTQDIPARWPSSVEILSGYGPTEVSIVCSMVDIRRDLLPTGLIGYSTGGKMWLVEPGNNERVVGLGEVGEIMVSSVMLSEGYFGDEGRTKAAFKQAPSWLQTLIPDGPKRVYMTGDLAVHLSNGELVSLGRADSQVKINGQRIELGEVEQQFIASGCAPGDAVVEACKLEAWKNKKMLVAFIQTGNVSESSSATFRIDFTSAARDQMQSLRTAVSTRLPKPWTPNIFVPVEVFPRSVSGKTDRKALRAMIQDSSVDQLLSLMSASKISYVEVSTENEKLLQAMWSSVLQIPNSQLSATAIFTDVGGDSIAAIRLSALALQQGWSLRVADIVKHSTLQAMAMAMNPTKSVKKTDLAPFALVPSSTSINELATLCEVEEESVEDAYPCTPLQEGIMAISQSRPGMYIGSFVYQLHSRITIHALQQAWNMVLARNPILRTRIVAMDDGTFIQVVRKHEASEFPVITLDELKAKQDIQKHNMGLGKDLVFAAVAKSNNCSKRLSLTVHHSIYDGWSMPLLMKELEDSLTNLSLPEVAPALFSEFVAFTQQDRQASIDFWSTQLEDAQPVDFPARPSLVYEAQTNSISIANLQYSARKVPSSVTVPLMLRAAWAMVLSRYTASDNVLFGAVLSGRNAPVAGIENLPAPTFTTVPVHIRLQDTTTLESLLKYIQEQSAAMIPHEQLGLRAISQKFTKDSGLPLTFNNLLLIQTSDHEPRLSEQERALISDELHSQTMSESYGLVVECVPEANGGRNVAVHIHFDDSLISEEAISWLSHHFQEAVRWVSTTPLSGRLADFDMASGADHMAAKAWNQDFPTREESCIHWQIQQQARIQPNAIALDATVGGKWTYEELDETSSRLALHLIHEGVRPGSNVPIMFEKGAWAVIAMLAVLKAGAAYVPLDPKDAASRHQHILRQTKATVVLAAEDNALAKHSIRCIAINALKANDWPTDTTRLVDLAQPGDAAYILFTSGSTGVPKGVVMEHSSLATAATAMVTRFSLGPYSRVYNFSSFTFDVSILDIFIALSSGATVCLPSETERLDDLSGSLQRFRASFAFLTPTMASLVDSAAAAGMDTIVLGGEAVTEDSLIHCRGAKNILAGYGPTETCILSASGSLRDGNRARIGKPLGGQLWVIDPLSPHDKPRLAAIGCEGELAISGNTLARHYLGDAEKTAAAFIENVEWLADQSAQRVYRTGDRVRFQPDGSVIFLGRLDAQIKHNGRRLELGEIEYHVAAAKRVEHAILAYPASGPWKKTLTAVIELAEDVEDQGSRTSGQSGTLEEVLLTSNQQIKTALSDVRANLVAKLPMYMMPQAWIVIGKMPRGSAAKIDRARISRWLHAASEETYELSQLSTEENTKSTERVSPLEEQIRGFWATVLNRPVARVALDVPFPQFSGDSVSAIQVASKAKRAGLRITAQDILRSQTIRQLAIIAEEAAAKSLHDVKTLITRPEFVENGHSFHLSPIQHMFFEKMAATGHQDVGTEAHFNQSFLLQLSSVVNQDKLETALHALVEQNPMLRVRFRQHADGKITQTITKDVSGSYEFYDLGDCTAIQANEHISIKQRNLNPITGPIFFATTMELDGNRLLFLSALHLVVDLMSWRVIAQQLKQYLAEEVLPAPVQSTSFHEWTLLQEEQTLILNHVTPPLPSYDLNFWGVAGQESTYAAIAQASFSLEYTTSTLLLSQSNKALASETIDSLIASLVMSFSSTFPERSVPSIHLEGHGREVWDDTIDITQTVGWFTTMHPITMNVDSTSNTVAAVRSAKDSRVRTPGRGRPYFAALYGNGPRQDSSHEIEILLNYAGGYGEIEGNENDTLLRMPDEAIANQIDNHAIGRNVRRPALIEVYAANSHGVLEVSFTWNSEMQHQDRIRQWINSTQTTLQRTASELLEAPVQCTLSDLDLFDGDHDNLDAIAKRVSEVLYDAQIEDIYPATTLQKRMIRVRDIGAQLFQVKQAYQFRLNKSIDEVVSQLSSAWRLVVQKHAALRSIIIGDNRNKLYNVVLKDFNAAIDTSWMTAGELAQSISEPLISDLGLPTLELVLQEGSDKAHLLLQISHTICDASSLAVIMDDLQAAYQGHLLSSSGFDMVHKKLSAHHGLSTQANHDSNEYWSKLLLEAKSTNISHHNVLYTGMYTSEDLTIPYTPALRLLGDHHGITIATALQAAWALTLHLVLEQDDVTFGYFSSGRDAPVSGIENAVGLFMNLCASRTQFDANTTVSDLLKSIQENFSQSLQHQGSCLDTVNSIADVSLFNTAFNFPKSSATTGHSERPLSTEVFSSMGGTDPMDFAILVRVTGMDIEEGIHVSLEYWPERTEAEVVKRAAEVFSKAVKWVAAKNGRERAMAFN